MALTHEEQITNLASIFWELHYSPITNTSLIGVPQLKSFAESVTKLRDKEIKSRLDDWDGDSLVTIVQYEDLYAHLFNDQVKDI